MPDDGVLERWMRLEMQRLQDALVRVPRPLEDLLREDEPSAPTRDGSVHRFDRAALRAVAERLSPLTRARLRLPISVYVDHETPGSAFVADAAAADALRELGATDLRPRDGRLWMSLPLLRELAARHGGLLQFIQR